MVAKIANSFKQLLIAMVSVTNLCSLV